MSETNKKLKLNIPGIISLNHMGVMYIIPPRM